MTKLWSVFTIFLLLGISRVFSAASSIPITFHHKMPLVSVGIQDEYFQFIFDLGSNDISLNKKIITRMNLPEIKETRTASNIYGINRTLKYYLAENVNIANASLQKYAIRECFEGDPETVKEIPQELTYGAFGRKFFMDKYLIIDYKNKTIVFDYAKNGSLKIPESYANRNWIPCDFHFTENSEVIISMVIENKTCNMLLDTGTNFSLLNSCSGKKKGNVKLPVSFKNGKSDGEYNFTIFQNNSFDFDGIMGFDFFEKHVVYLDFVNKKILID